MRDSVVFYRSFYEAIKDFPPDQFTASVKAIMEYGLDEKEPETAGIEKAIFLLVKPQIDANNKRYQNGTKGGRPKSKEEPKHNQTVTKQKPTDNQTSTETEPKEKEKEKEKVKDNVKDKKTYTCAFETLWDAYPRKKEKAMAYKQYLARLNNGFSEDELMTAVKRYAEECRKNNTEQRYIKQGATFLGPSTPFVDYLGDDYRPENLGAKGKATKFSNFQGRKYDVDSLESQLLQAGTWRIKHESI